jgi:hypothetical protein
MLEHQLAARDAHVLVGFHLEQLLTMNNGAFGQPTCCHTSSTLVAVELQAGSMFQKVKHPTAWHL